MEINLKPANLGKVKILGWNKDKRKDFGNDMPKILFCRKSNTIK